jgi:carbamoyltransferase
MTAKILGISAFYHDSAAALIEDGKILAAAQEERFTRKKQDASFPANAIRYCLEYSGLNLSDIDKIVFYEKPFLKFERLLETYYAMAPSGIQSFLAAIPVWMKEKLFIKKLLLDEFTQLDTLSRKQIREKLLFSEHHLSHAASAFYPSPFTESAILTIDGVGEWATTSIGKATDNKVQLLKELHFPHSPGLLYSAFTYFLGFKVNSGEYKLMGLSPYGNPGSDTLKHYKKCIYETLIDLKEDGSIFLNQEYFDYATGLRMVKDKKWEKLFKLAKREPETELKQEHCDMALAIQQVTEDIVFKMAKTAKDLTGSNYLCMAGGVALNCVANGKLLASGIFDDIWIQPASGDAGGALGAALAVYYMYYNKERTLIDNSTDLMQGAYLGPDYSESDIIRVAKKYKAVYERYEDFDILCDKIAKEITEGKVIGWFQGRMEWGPRALGNRSIIGDARNEDMQKRLNIKIKYRESFRPFAPAVLIENVQDYFKTEKPSPYMLLIADVQEGIRNEVPDNYNKMEVREKLYHIRSTIPAVTHIDYSARLQTAHKETNEKYWKLINRFKEITGYGVIVNTSFNVRGEPIVCTPEDAYKCFMRTDMDFLVMDHLVFDKAKQPDWQEEKNWKEDLILD